jgi:outer membrane protein OmpA-like peptidoglycan-associated protein
MISNGMSKSLSFLACMLFSSFVMGQRVYWAEEVVDFTSQLSPVEYSAQQVLGKPDVMPQGGDSPNAWMPSKPNRLEYITVSFEKPMRIRQVIIAESYNPSALFEIYFYDRSGNEHLVHTFNPRPLELKGRVLNVFIERPNYQVYSLKLVVDGRAVPGYNAIDAIGVSDARKAVEVEILQPETIKEKILVEKLDENVNSSFMEARPLIAPDGRTLYFSRAFHPDNVGGEKDESDIWYSAIDDASGEWKEASNIGSPLNNRGANYVSSITPDGNAMTVLLGNQYAGKNRMKPGVSISTKTSSGWSTPQDVDIINANIETTDGHYFLANNRKTIIMSVYRYDAFGGTDLYVSFLQPDGRWTEPLNLGNDINTAHMETSPYLAADNETLYFSTGGYSGYGESDVYISRRLDDTWTNWTEPENLGPDINGEGNDMFFNIPPSGKYAYYARSDQRDPGDIHRIELPIFYQPAPVASVSGTTLLEKTGEPVQAKITYTLQPENTEIGFVMSDSITGEYEILLPVGSAYTYRAEAPEMEAVENTINLGEETDFSEIRKDIVFSGEPTPVLAKGPEEEPAEEAVTPQKDAAVETSDFTAKEVYFDFASEHLDPGKYPFLKQVAEYLKNHSNVVLVLSGHTDNIGPDQYNLGLSRRRAIAVKQYLLQRGVEEEQVVVEAYGQAKPVATNDTPEGRSKNRRVELSTQ